MWGGGGGGGRSLKTFFRLFGPPFGLKLRGGGGWGAGLPGSSSGSATGENSEQVIMIKWPGN